MRTKAVVLLIALLTIAGSVSAQTATPTPDPSCQDVLKVLERVFFGGACAGGQVVDIEDSMENDIYRNMATAAAIVQDLPEQIKNSGPNGQSLADAMAGASQVFGYIKWLLSPNSAQELLGRSLAPVGINIMIILTMVIALTTIYIAINMAVYILKMAIWVVNQILKLIPFW
jgi:hypothetical protein